MAWSASGLPGATADPVSLTFPSAGFYSVRVAFKDNAGEAALGVSVGSPLPPTDFCFDAKRKKIDKKAPLAQKLTVKKLEAGSKHTLMARAFPKVRRGQEPDEVDQHELHDLRLTGERLATGHTCDTRE